LSPLPAKPEAGFFFHDMQPSTAPNPVSLPAERQYYSTRLLVARYQTSRRRAAAMCLPDDLVMGLYLRPITPASFSMLLATGNAFTLAGIEPRIADIRDYIWFHSSGFTTDLTRAKAEKSAVMAKLERHALPPWRAWRYSRASRLSIRSMAYALAGNQIAEIVAESFADAPPPSSGGGGVGASLEAQFIDLFAREYGWEPERISATPIRQLYQFLRCINPTDYDADEARIIAEDLAAANAKN
jgi:hypothetical protein